MREIARAFGAAGDDRIAIKRLLAEMADEGLLEKRGKRVNRKGTLPPVALVDIIARDRDGEMIAAPVEWDEDELGTAPRIRIHAPRRARPGEPLPGVGDRALVRAEPDRDAGPDEPPYVGRVVKLLSRQRQRVLGVLHIEANGAGRIEPIDKNRPDANSPSPRPTSAQASTATSSRSTSSARRALARRAPACAKRSAR